jgi:hypothetical protein
MKMLRINAGLVINTSVMRDHRLSILCGVGDDLRILRSGPWYGHEFMERTTYPFMLQVPEKIFWGYDDNTSEKTNIGRKVMEVDELITLFGDPASHEFGWSERLFKITEVVEIR